MDKHIEKLYQQAMRFDEGSIYQTKEYKAISQKQFMAYTEMLALFGPAIAPLLDAFTDAVGDEIEFECKHFFEQGYRMGTGE